MDGCARLLEIADRLLGPNGCPWDHKQDFLTLRKYLLEETYELLEALDLQDSDHIQEELGDVLYILVFIAKIAQMRQLFTFGDAVSVAAEKMIRRHPHVFGDTQANSIEEVAENWDKIKKQEKKGARSGSLPPGLPALALAQKIIQKEKKVEKIELKERVHSTEQEIAQELFEIVRKAEFLGIDAESVFRQFMLKKFNQVKKD